MDLRPPPRPPAENRPDRLVRALLALNLVVLAAVGALVWLRPGAGPAAGSEAERGRQVASKLKAAGALDEAAAAYERYLAAAEEPPEVRARIAYSVGLTYLDRGRYEKALRWLYEAEALGDGSLAEELEPKIVHCLERLGRRHAAQAVLDSRAPRGAPAAAPAGDDPVVARIGQDEIRRSDLRRALDDLPPEIAAAFGGTAGLAEFLKQYVADELIWRKAAKLEYDRDPEVERRHAAVLKQLAVGRFVEREVVDKIALDEADLRTYFEANRERYETAAAEGKPARPAEFDAVRPAVERDYRLFKIQSAYQSLIEAELSAANVELFPERLGDAG